MRRSEHRSLRCFLLVLSVLYLVMALVANEWFVAFFLSPDNHLSAVNLWLIRSLTVFFAGLSFLTFIFRSRSWLVGLNLSLWIFVLGLAGIEFFLRNREMSESELARDLQRVRHPDPVLHHRLEPNREGRLQWGNRVVTYSINDAGMRDVSIRKVSRNKPVNTYRILVLGDSFAECIGVEYEEGFPGLTEEMLSEEFEQDFEVLNGGVASYSPRLQYRRLLQLVEQGYQFDHVLLFFDNSDVHDEGVVYRSWHTFSEEELRYKQKERERLLQQAENTDRSHHLYHLLYPRIFDYTAHFIEALRAGDPFLGLLEKDRYMWTERDDLPWEEPGLAMCQEYILKMQALCDAQNIAFSLVIYPYPIQIMSDHLPSQSESIFAELSERHDIELISLYPAFRECRNWRALFVPGDIHWTAKGHTFVAETIVDALCENGAFP